MNFLFLNFVTEAQISEGAFPKAATNSQKKIDAHQENNFGVKDLGFRYNATKNECQNKNGDHGTNLGLMECGQLLGKKFESLVIEGKNLNGIYFDKCTFNKMSFLRTTLNGAVFHDSQIQDSVFKNVELKGAQIVLSDKKACPKKTEFQNILIDSKTYLPCFEYSSLSLLSSGQAKYVPFSGAHKTHLQFLKSGFHYAQIVKDDLLRVSNEELFKFSPKKVKDVFNVRIRGTLKRYFQKHLDTVALDFEKNLRQRFSKANNNSGLETAAYNSTNRLFFNFQLLLDQLDSSKNYYMNYVKQFLTDYNFLINVNGGQSSLLNKILNATSLMFLTPSYFNDISLGKMSILVHESRHSACYVTAEADFQHLENLKSDAITSKKKLLKAQKNASKIGITKAKQDFSKYINQFLVHRNFLRTSSVCGHAHATCNSKTDYEGAVAACDNVEWGAYWAVGYFNKVFFDHCEDCSFFEKQMALVASADSFSRVHNLENYVNGHWNDPPQRQLSDMNLHELVEALKKN